MSVARKLTPLRRHGATITFAALACIGFTALFIAGRHGSFYNDEWHLVGIDGFGSVDDWVRPWGAHWSLIPLIVWKSIFALVGLRSYLPYLAVLLACHIVASAGLYTVIRRASGEPVALCAAAVFLLLGSAWANLFWAFQLGFVISTAAALWAMVAFEGQTRRSKAAGAALVMVSLASSGMGVPFAVAIGLELGLDARRRRMVAWLVPPALVFVAWYVVWGYAGTVTTAVTGRSDLETILSFLVLGPGSYIHALVGVGMPGEAALYVGGVSAILVMGVRRSLNPRVVALVVGLAVMLAMLAIGRGIYGISTTAQPRYVYEGVAFLLLLASALIGRRVARLPTTPGQATLATAVAVLALVALTRNIGMIPTSSYFVDAAGELRAVVALTERYGAARLNAPIAPGDRSVIPDPSVLQRFMNAYGRVDTDAFRPTVVVPPTAEQRDRALWRTLGETVRPSATTEPVARTLPPLLQARQVTVTGPCVQAEPLGSVMLELEAGEAVAIRGVGRWSIGMGHESDPQQNEVLGADLGNGWYRVAVPDLEDGIRYRLSLQTDGSEPWIVCGITS